MAKPKVDIFPITTPRPEALEEWERNIGKCPNVQEGHKWALGVADGSTPAGNHVRMAVDRYFRWIEHEDGLIYFEPKRAEFFMDFASELKHVKGPLRGHKFRIEPWQCFIFLNMFGWMDVATQQRVIRRGYVEVPRGNGKSFMASAVGLYMLSCDGEGGPEIYSAATSRDQAKIVWDDAKKMVRMQEDFLQKVMGIQPYAHEIKHAPSDGVFRALSAEGGYQDGLNIHLAIVDELHAHKNREVYDVLITGMGKRDQSLMFVITTAGTDTGGIGYEEHTYAKKVLEGSVEGDDYSYFPIIFSVDPWDDWNDEKAWEKANPNWQVSVKPEVLRALHKKAVAIPANQPNFRTKHLNEWMNAAHAWMEMQKWDAAECAVTLEDLRGEDCYLGVDIASRVDIAAAAFVFPMNEDLIERFSLPDSVKYLMFHKYWLPQARIDESTGQGSDRDKRDSRNSQYFGWVEDGWIETTPGQATDLNHIEAQIETWAQEHYGVLGIAFDPFQAVQMSQSLEAKGLEVVEFRNTVLTMSEPMKEMQAMTYTGALLHEANPCTRWQMSNVVAKADNKDNIFPRKERPENKIDGPVAGIMALGLALFDQEESGSIYDEDEWWH